MSYLFMVYKISFLDEEFTKRTSPSNSYWSIIELSACFIFVVSNPIIVKPALTWLDLICSNTDLSFALSIIVILFFDIGNLPSSTIEISSFLSSLVFPWSAITVTFILLFFCGYFAWINIQCEAGCFYLFLNFVLLLSVCLLYLKL